MFYSIKVERKNYIQIGKSQNVNIKNLLRKAKLDGDKEKVRVFAELLYSGKLIEDKSNAEKDKFYSTLVLNQALRSSEKLSKEVEEVRKVLIDNGHYFECDISQNDLIAEDIKIIEIKETLDLTNCTENYSDKIDANLMDLVANKICKHSDEIVDLLDKLNIKFTTKLVESYITKAKSSITKALGELVIWLKKYKKIVMFSGGKDSAAMLIKMIEQGERIDKIIFADTRLEFPELYQYIKDVEKYIKKEITIVRGDITFDDWFYGKWTRGKSEGITRGFPKVLGLGCWAKRELKIKPIRKVEGVGNEIFVGIAYDEKERAYREDYQHNNIYRLPLIDWKMTEKDCIDYLEERNLSNPLYEKFKRLGCYLCPKQGLGSLKSLYRYYPDLWEQLKIYENDSPTGFRINTTLKELEKRFENEIWLEKRQLSLFQI